MLLPYMCYCQTFHCWSSCWSASIKWNHHIVGAGGLRKNWGSHIDASHSRQPLVKGERLVRHEVNAVMLNARAVLPFMFACKQWQHVRATLTTHSTLLPRRVCCSQRCAMPVQHVKVSEQAQEHTSPVKNTCDKQVSSWRHISCHTDKNRYYTWS